MNEDGALEIFQYLEENGLSYLGSIHTHPGFGAFLSSVDLHMAAQIQKDVPQSLAIVVSNRDGTNPIYRLTIDGMKEILNCEEDGKTIHSHSNEGFVLYKESPVKYVDNGSKS